MSKICTPHQPSDTEYPDPKKRPGLTERSFLEFSILHLTGSHQSKSFFKPGSFFLTDDPASSDESDEDAPDPPLCFS
jgi:hypothetical protein